MPISRSIVRAAGTPLVGTSPTETRLALAAFVSRAAAAAWGARPGVLWGGAISGTAGWAYNVAPAALISTRGALEGVYPSANTGISSVGTDPAPASGSRIDIVYALQQDIDVGDLGNAAQLGVAIGAASGAPIAPSIPAGALELGRNTMTSTATTTASAGNTITSTAPFTALAGGMYEVPTVASLTRIVSPLDLEVARVGNTDLYIRQGGAWRSMWTAPGGVTRRQVLTGAGVLTIPNPGSIGSALATIDTGSDGIRTVSLLVTGVDVPYSSTTPSTSVWGTVVAALRPVDDVSAQFTHPTNVGLGWIKASGELAMRWGTFSTTGTTNIRCTANYPLPAL